MRKVNLLIMSGAMGLLCAGSTAVLAQSAPPGGSKTNASETKPPFKIPNGGKFTYRGKSPQGEVRLMEVDWKTSGLIQKTGTTRISGDVKYKNPKTGKMDSLTIYGEKSYITKTGELFFALNDGGKVFGPVDLAALQVVRLAKSDKPAESKESGPGVSATGISTSTTQSGNPSINSNTPLKTLDKPDSLENNDKSDSVEKTANSTLSQRCAFKNSKAYDDRYKASGSFRAGNDTFHWQQAKSTLGNHRRILVRYERTCSLLGAADQHKSILNDQGQAHAYFKGKSVKSKANFYSDNFKTLKKAHNLIKAEDDYIRMFGSETLPGALRNKKKTIVTTEGALILGATIKSIGKENIAHKRTPLGIQAFNSIQGLLKLEKSDWVVHRMVQHAGLKVEHHPTRGRSLVQGETSAAGAAMTQYNTNVAIVGAAPDAPGGEAFNRLAFGIREVRYINDRDVDQAVGVLNTGLQNPQERQRYVAAMANYLLGQRHVFEYNIPEAQRRHFQDDVDDLLGIAMQFRNGSISWEEFNRRRILIQRSIQYGLLLNRRGADVAAANIVELVLQMRGFERTREAFRATERARLVATVAMARIMRDAHDRELLLETVERMVAIALALIWTGL